MSAQPPDPPSGQQPAPGPSAPWTAPGPLPGTQPAGPPLHQATPPGYPVPPGAYGTNAFAIVALICALTGFSPVAVVFGILALLQLRRRPERGRGMAIAGIVLGSLGTLFFAAILAAVIISAPERDASGRVTGAGTQNVESLVVGDCFDGIKEGRTTSVKVVPCGTPHEAEVGAVVTLPESEFPGADEAAALTEEQCIDALDPLIDPNRYGDVDLFYLYPDSAYAWRSDRTGICVVIGLDGRKLTGSVLQTTDNV